jgi:hypothetical protein
MFPDYGWAEALAVLLSPNNPVVLAFLAAGFVSLLDRVAADE